MHQAYPDQATSESPDPAELAARVAARICHDLVSPCGAVVNGIDLIREMGGGGSAELEVVAETAGRASDLIQFLRLTFGSPGGPEDRVRLGDLDARIAVLTTRRVSVERVAPGGEGRDVSRTEARLACLALLTARSALGLSGRLMLEFREGAVIVTAEGPSASLSPHMAAWLEGRGPAGPLPEAKEIEIVLLPLAARQAGRQLEARAEDGRLSFLISGD